MNEQNVSIHNMAFQREDETELQARTRIIRNAFRDEKNCIVLKVDTYFNTEKGVNPFGFHFEMDHKKYQERKKQLKRERMTRWLAWIAYYHHKFGIRHLILVLLLTGYVFAGGYLFNRLEANNELEDLKSTLVLMQGIIREMSAEAINLTLVEVVDKGNYTVGMDKMGKLIKRYYKEMLEAEGRFHGSVWHKAENLELHLMWYFSSATFYAMTLFTTIGYGTITCQTFWGRFMSIVYASIGIPLMLVTLGDVGEWFQKIVTKCYVFLLLKYKSLRKQKIDRPLDEIYLPIYYALAIVTIYILMCTLIIKEFDRQEGNKPGIDFGSALYFVFISLTTIGLGDVMPYNIQYSPFLAAAFLLGLAMVSIVNTSIYAVMYDIFFQQVEKTENWLDRIHNRHNKPHGWRVFKDMEPCIRVLICSFPHFEKSNRDRMLTMLNKTFNQQDALGTGIQGMLARTLWTTAGLHHLNEKNANGDIEQGIPDERPIDRPNEEPKKKVGFSIIRARTNSDLAGHERDRQDSFPSRIPSFKRRERAPTLGAFGGFELNKFRKMRNEKRKSIQANQVPPPSTFSHHKSTDSDSD